jgi:hypothetical protein
MLKYFAFSCALILVVLQCRVFVTSPTITYKHFLKFSLYLLHTCVRIYEILWKSS